MDQSKATVSQVVRECGLGYTGIAMRHARILALVFADEAEAARKLLDDAIGDQDVAEPDEPGMDLVHMALGGIENPRQVGSTAWPIEMQGTGFQHQVWEALRQIPCGETRSYQEVAGMIGRPRAARAVARACAGNRIGFLIPCHRVTGKSSLSGYRWGEARKRQLLLHEGADLSAF